MKWLELLNMEYGECVVLGGGDRSLLMVDCGSVSQKLRQPGICSIWHGKNLLHSGITHRFFHCAQPFNNKTAAAFAVLFLF
mgnify:CR=1 FL=1